MFLPAILYVVALVGVPFVLAFFYAVGDVKVGSVGYHFVGLANFESVLQSPAFRPQRSYIKQKLFIAILKRSPRPGIASLMGCE